jgi:hypothetical protein
VAASPAIPTRKPGRCSVSSALASHILKPLAFFKGQKAARSVSARASPAHDSRSGYVQSRSLTVFFRGFPHAHTRSEEKPRLQASQNELAEPYKYSNRHHTSSTEVSRILLPRRMRRREIGPRGMKLLSGGESFALAREFGNARLRSEHLGPSQ